MNHPKIILILDPDVLVRSVIAEYLRECGYTVIEGIKADDFHRLREKGAQVDIVLMDVSLSGEVNGFALSRDIRHSYPGIDVILTSSIGGVAKEAHELCDEGPIRKPYRPQDIEVRIKSFIERRRGSIRP